MINIYIYRKFVPVVRLGWLAPARQLYNEYLFQKGLLIQKKPRMESDVAANATETKPICSSWVAGGLFASGIILYNEYLFQKGLLFKRNQEPSQMWQMCILLPSQDNLWRTQAMVGHIPASTNHCYSIMHG